MQIEEAGKNQMVVGSQARILYSNQAGRACIALAFNKAIASGHISAPIVSTKYTPHICRAEHSFRLVMF